MDPAEIPGRLHGTLINLEGFDRAYVRPHLDSSHALSPREVAIGSTYLRTLGNVRTLILLSSADHFQAIAMLSRSILELAVELHLIDVIPDAAEAFNAYERLEKVRSARRIVEFYSRGSAKPVPHVQVYERFLAENADKIEALAKRLWPGKTPLHWSGLRLRDRALRLKAPFDELHEVHYQQLSWNSHPGSAGVLNLDAKMFPLLCGMAYEVAIKSYVLVLGFMIAEMKLKDRDDLIENRLRFAQLAAMCSSQEEADGMRRELLGD
ncbi:MAG: DUF5677 domain-containing protein [Acidobacteriota bacterium]